MKTIKKSEMKVEELDDSPFVFSQNKGKKTFIIDN